MTIHFCDSGEKFSAKYPDDLSVKFHWSRDKICFKAAKNPCSVLQIQNWKPKNRDRFVGCNWELDADYQNTSSKKASFSLTGMMTGTNSQGFFH